MPAPRRRLLDLVVRLRRVEELEARAALHEAAGETLREQLAERSLATELRALGQPPENAEAPVRTTAAALRAAAERRQTLAALRERALDRLRAQQARADQARQRLGAARRALALAIERRQHGERRQKVERRLTGRALDLSNSPE